MSEMKQELFEKAGIGIPHEDIETNDVAIFGYVNTSFIFYFSECEGEVGCLKREEHFRLPLDVPILM